jgi:hypothetical protein
MKIMVREALPPSRDWTSVHYRQPIGSPPPRASDAEILATAARWEKRNPEFAAELRRRVLLGI